MSSKQLLLPARDPAIFTERVLGFWIYLMTDCILFSMLFTTFLVLRSGTFGGPNISEIVHLPYTFIQTCALLLSSITCGLAVLALLRDARKWALFWFVTVLALGATFVGMELAEFRGLVHEGNSWHRSAFLSSFFTLVGTHGLHVSIGLIWLTIMLIQLGLFGIVPATFRRLVYFTMFWHFLDLVWIFLFTIVYLLGVI